MPKFLATVVVAPGEISPVAERAVFEVNANSYKEAERLVDETIASELDEPNVLVDWHSCQAAPAIHIEEVALNVSLTIEELSTVLAALRYYQESGQGDPANRSDRIHGIATNGDEDLTSLDSDGIDELCERLNSHS